MDCKQTNSVRLPIPPSIHRLQDPPCMCSKWPQFSFLHIALNF